MTYEAPQPASSVLAKEARSRVWVGGRPAALLAARSGSWSCGCIVSGRRLGRTRGGDGFVDHQLCHQLQLRHLARCFGCFLVFFPVGYPFFLSPRDPRPGVCVHTHTCFFGKRSSKVPVYAILSLQQQLSLTLTRHLGPGALFTDHARARRADRVAR